MDNAEIADALNGIADLLEIQDGNRFKIRAYRNAVRTVTGLTRPLDAMVEAGADLTTLAGIGKDIAGYIKELVATGRTQRLTELEKELPASLGDLMHLDGIGPKRAKQLHEVLAIESVADLRRAIEAGDVERIPGFGPKTVAALKRSLARKRLPKRFKLIIGERVVGALVEYMRRAPGLERIEPAGSYRRRVETVGDLDLLAVCDDAEPVMSHFCAFPDVARVTASGATRGTVILGSGMQVDLRIVPAESYGAALHYFTGSKAHNIAVRALGVRRGLRISEYGVFRVDGENAGKRSRRRAGVEDGKRIAGATEAEVFGAVSMKWVPPELREDRGEVEAALQDSLPELVELDDIRGDVHMHTTRSDGRDSLESMARGCIARGYSYMAITDHSRAAAIARGFGPDQLEEQWAEIDAVQKKLPGIRIYRGMEVDILRDGSLDLPDEYLEALDIVIVSVHSSMRLSKRDMTRRVIRAIEHPSVDILGHPTGRLINDRPPYEIDVDAVLEAAAALDIAVELNAQPHRLDLKDVHLMRARELGVKVAIDTDAHSVDSLDMMRGGVDQARRGWLTRADVINTLSPARFDRWLRRREGKDDS